MLALLGEAALRTLFLAAFVQLGLVLFRVREPLLHLPVWTAVLAASLLMPLLQWASPVQLAVLPDIHALALGEVAGMPWHATTKPLPARMPVGGVATSVMPIAWLEVSYFIVAGILLIRLTVGIILAVRLLGRAEPVRPDWGGGARIRISRDIASPITVAKIVLLPSDAMEWPTPMRHAVLAHERAHIDRWDFAMLVAAQVNQAIFWFSPFSWWLHRRLAVLAELASDDQAVAATGDIVGYAEILLEMGRRSGPLLRGVAMARPATLHYRIERVLSEHVSRASPSLVQRMIFTAVAVGLAVMVATSRTIPSSTTDPSLPRALESLVEPTQPGSSIDPMPPPSEISAVESPTSALSLPAVGDASQVGAREAATRTPSPLPMRPTVQPARAARGPGGNAVQSGVKLVTAAELIPRRDGEPGIVGSVGVTRREAQGSLSPTRAAEAEPLVPRSGDEPSCTGVYFTKPGSPGLDGQAELVRVNYFHAADGTPWVKLLFGSRIQTRMNGFTVERTSVRATVVAAAPKDAGRISGSSHGVFGSIDYECLRPNARL